MITKQKPLTLAVCDDPLFGELHLASNEGDIVTGQHGIPPPVAM